MNTAGIAIVRSAVPQDVPLIAACVEEAYSPYIERIGKAPAPMRSDFDALVGKGLVRVAEREGELLGVIVAWAEPDHFYVDNIAVTNAGRGGGLGALLLDDAMAAARRLSLPEIRLYTNAAMVENLAWYPRRGFEETHREVQDGYDRVFYRRSVPRQ